ncbi:Cell adhesion molecule /down-regulated by oncogene [Fasciola gigantica]|uniref:Cell adhesion molecule /down-regulated by oncogene n=1 Tax=Fasciola gigantica TaxID=46835 RepID=A0A504YJ80_FASGI|nr:Cell adhesion molecule /down-regulated by oncogene [Fasciola gigantica]
MLTGLNRTASYQVIVYGVRGDGDRRQITRFSKAAYVNLATADHAGPYSLLRSLINNRLMYIILGGIAAVMFFVVLVCILLCLCRQRRGRRESSQRKKQSESLSPMLACGYACPTYSVAIFQS